MILKRPKLVIFSILSLIFLAILFLFIYQVNYSYFTSLYPSDLKPPPFATLFKRLLFDPEPKVYQHELFSFEYPSYWEVERYGVESFIIKPKNFSIHDTCTIRITSYEKLPNYNQPERYSKLEPISFKHSSGTYRAELDTKTPTPGGCGYSIDVFIPVKDKTLVASFDKHKKEDLFAILDTLKLTK